MNTLIENGSITETVCGTNFSYILNDSSTFLSTEYKVLQSQSVGSFIKCMKMLYNGKVQLYYLIKTLKPLSSMISTLDPDSFLTIVSNLFSNIIDVTHNGFLSCRNIDIAFERIYVDPATYKVSLVYLPVGERIFDDIASFENELRTNLVKLISGIPSLASPKMLRFSDDLSNGTLTLEDLCVRIKGGREIGTAPVQPVAGDTAGNRPGTLRIIAMNAPSHVEIVVTKDEFIIGKKRELVDGVVSFNNMISRSHCKVSRHGGQFTVTDLQSANGTFVNRVRLQPNQPYPIKNGDIIRMANSDFQVSIG